MNERFEKLKEYHVMMQERDIAQLRSDIESLIALLPLTLDKTPDDRIYIDIDYENKDARWEKYQHRKEGDGRKLISETHRRGKLSLEFAEALNSFFEAIDIGETGEITMPMPATDEALIIMLEKEIEKTQRYIDGNLSAAEAYKQDLADYEAALKELKGKQL